MRIAAPIRSSLLGTLLFAVAEIAQAQFPTSVPSSPNMAQPSAPHLVDPSPVYHAPVYQPQPGAAPAPSPAPSSTYPTYTPWMASRQPPVPTVAPTPYPNVAPTPYPTSSLPGYGSGSGGPAYAQPAPPTYGEMPAATYDRQTFPPYGSDCGPPKYSACMPTHWRPLFKHGCGGHGAYCNEYDPCCDPACNPGCCGDFSNWYDNIFGFVEMNAFKGGLDLDGLNANFGTRVGAQGAFPVMRSWGLGAQFGSSYGVYDWKGSQYTGDGTRTQTFTTAGVFQRFCSTGFGYAVVYDWLVDDYYHDFFFGQWRAAASWQWNACNEIGAWVALPDRRDEAYVGTPAVRNDFSSVVQGNFYWRHVWSCAASTTIFGGLAENPSDIPFGASAQVAINNYLALTGGFEYILPSSGGNQGREEEIWALSFGMQFYPGSAMRVAQSQFRPFLPIADNGNFAIRRH